MWIEMVLNCGSVNGMLNVVGRLNNFFLLHHRKNVMNCISLPFFRMKTTIDDELGQIPADTLVYGPSFQGFHWHEEIPSCNQDLTM